MFKSIFKSKAPKKVKGKGHDVLKDFPWEIILEQRPGKKKRNPWIIVF